MGNAGSATITVQQTAYYPGDWVQGTLLVNLKQDVQGTLKLKFHSTVRTSHSYQVPNDPSNPGNGTHTQTDYDKFELVKVDVPFSPQPISFLAAGEYKFPFTFQLPLQLHPTFYRDADSCTAHMDNGLKAEFDIPGAKDLKSKCPIKILSAPQRPAGVLQFPTEHQTVKSCWCFSSGSVAVSVVKGGPDIVAIGQQLGFQVDVNNHSNHTFKAVKIEIKEDVTLRCKGTRKIDSKQKLLTYDLPAKVEAGQERTVMSPEGASVWVPEQAQPTVKAEGMLETTHRFYITLVNDSKTGSDVVVKSSPFTVISKQGA